MTDCTAHTPPETGPAHERVLAEDAAPPDPRREGYIALLGDLAALLTANPWLASPYVNSDGELHFCLFEENAREHVAAVRRLMGGAWKKRASENGDYLSFLGTWHGFPVEISVLRTAVCRKVVTTEVRDVEEVVRRAVVRMVPKPVEVVTWECEPLLAPDADETEAATA
jgi:hypothetical protein